MRLSEVSSGNTTEAVPALSHLRGAISSLTPPLSNMSARLRQLAVKPIDATTSLSGQVRRDAQAHDIEPRIVFLFLTYTGINRIDLWHAFFANAPTNRWAALMHCKDHAVCEHNLAMHNPFDIKLVETVMSSYCTDLVSPMVALLRQALSMGGYAGDKFVFVSETTLPVKPFTIVYASLTQTENSDFCVSSMKKWIRLQSRKTGSFALLPKHSQWVVLNKPHADTLVQRWPRVAGDNVDTWSLPLLPEGQQTLPSTSDFVSVQKGLPICLDEWVVFSTIFGAIDVGHQTKIDLPHFNGGPLKLTGTQVELSGQGACRTFVTWGWAASKESFSIAHEFIADAPLSRLSCYPICKESSPAEITAASDRGLSVLRNSQFLFARKFASGIVTPRQYQTIILSQITETIEK